MPRVVVGKWLVEYSADGPSPQAFDVYYVPGDDKTGFIFAKNPRIKRILFFKARKESPKCSVPWTLKEKKEIVSFFLENAEMLLDHASKLGACVYYPLVK